MSIRFTCTACRTVLKLGEMIAEPRKVRCTGCGIVILVEPDPANPLGVKSSIPERMDKTTKRIRQEQARFRIVLVGGLVVLGIGLAIGIWLTVRTPSDRAAIEGEVKLDGTPLERGTIVFVPEDKSKSPVGVPITSGSYSIGAGSGPFIGANTVQISGSGTETVAARFNTESKKTIEIKAGANKEDFLDVMSK